MIRDFCFQTLKELKNYTNTDREDLLFQYINERLDKSFITYQEEITQGLSYLKHRNELNVLRKMNRMK